MTFLEMEKLFMDALRLYHHPVAITFLHTEKDREAFCSRVGEYVVPVHPMTFCQWEIAARMEAKTVVGGPNGLGCTNAQVSFGWHDIDAGEIKSQSKYCTDRDQAFRFINSKPRLLHDSVTAIAAGPLGKTPYQPDVVHFYCDNMQAYHLSVDYMASTNTHPLHPLLTMCSVACGGSVYCYQQQTFNESPSCSGGYNAGKTERGETNVFIPGSQIAAVALRLKDRIDACGEASITHPGDPFPGRDICKNCGHIVFKPGKSSACE